MRKASVDPWCGSCRLLRHEVSLRLQRYACGGDSWKRSRDHPRIAERKKFKRGRRRGGRENRVTYGRVMGTSSGGENLREPNQDEESRSAADSRSSRSKSTPQ